MSQNKVIWRGALTIKVADRFWSRAKGLLFKSDLGINEGLLIRPCSSVHTVGMRFSIDVLFLDSQGRVQEIRRNLAPNRAAASRKAAAVLELAAGGCNHHALTVGDKFELL